MDLAPGLHIACRPQCPFRAYTDDASPPEPRLSRTTPEDRTQSEQASLLYSQINDWQTRILILKPGRCGDELQADLSTLDLIHGIGAVLHEKQVRIQYEALSYTWGRPIFDHLMYMNGIAYPITENLHGALQRLRPERGQPERFLWVDAVCINQFDLSERAMQVSNMLTIYRKARGVVIWLGGLKEHSSLCLSYLQQHWTSHFVALNVHGPDGLVASSCPEHLGRFIDGLAELLDRPWHRRIWIRQEVWAAKDLIVHLGGFQFDPKALSVAAGIADALKESELGFPGIEESYRSRYTKLAQAQVGALAIVDEPRLTGLAAAMSSLQGAGRSTALIYVLQQAAHCECSDLRDHVYGVLGMTTCAPVTTAGALMVSRSLIVDYRLSVVEVFASAARYIIRADCSLSILLLTATYGGQVEGLQLPSWCPDWTQPFGMAGYVSRAFPGTDIHAIDSTLFADDWTLRVEGVTFGEVLSTVHEFSEDSGLRQYATIRHKDLGPKLQLQYDRKPEAEYEVIGPTQCGDIVIATEHCFRLLLLRPANSDDSNYFRYIGWVYDRSATRSEAWKSYFQDQSQSGTMTVFMVI